VRTHGLGQVLGHDLCVGIGGIGSVPGLLALGSLRLVRLDVLAKVGFLSLHRCSVFSVVVRKRYWCSRFVGKGASKAREVGGSQELLVCVRIGG
jgi:hypothetical protein